MCNGKEIDHVEHVVAFEQSLICVHELARGFTVVYKDGTKLDLPYHEPDVGLMEALKKQGRLKLVSQNYGSMEEAMAVLISELRRDGKDQTTLAAKAYEAKRRQERAAKKAGVKTLPA